mmetsp:Transcript_16112/g.43931  ORF Transcript_16112/g.43931 Transcript_16112/m.43931 type:complete len:202 (+) Transcript_16112:1971-2576(+)
MHKHSLVNFVVAVLQPHAIVGAKDAHVHPVRGEVGCRLTHSLHKNSKRVLGVVEDLENGLGLVLLLLLLSDGLVLFLIRIITTIATTAVALPISLAEPSTPTRSSTLRPGCSAFGPSTAFRVGPAPYCRPWSTSCCHPGPFFCLRHCLTTSIPHSPPPGLLSLLILKRVYPSPGLAPARQRPLCRLTLLLDLRDLCDLSDL